MDRRFAGICILLGMLILLQSVPYLVRAENNFVDILQIDSYTKSVRPGEKAIYNWTILNAYPQNYTFTVYINITNPDSKWNVTVHPTVIANFTQKTAKKVVLEVIPLSDAKGSLNVTTIFTVLQENAVVQIETRKALTTILAPPEEKKILGYFKIPLPRPLDNEYGVFILNVLAWLGIALFAAYVLLPLFKLGTSKTKTRVDDIIFGIIRTPILVLLFLYGFVSSLFILEKDIPKGVLDYSMQIYGVGFVLVLIYVGYRLFRDVFVYYLKRIARKTATNIDDILIPIVEKFGIVVIAVAALGYILGYLNINVTMFIAGGVVVSMVIAFAAQETLSNFFSGIFLLTDRPFTEGDTVILSDNDWYEVRKIGLRSTRLFRFKDASLVSIPNNKLANEKVANFTGVEDKGRVMKTFGVAYGSEPEKVKTLIREVIAGCEHIINDNPDLKPIVRFDEMADSSLNFFVLVWITDRKYRFDVLDYLNTNIYKRLNEEGIEIPFPQRTVHVRYEQPSQSPSPKPAGKTKVGGEPPLAQKQDAGFDDGGAEGAV